MTNFRPIRPSSGPCRPTLWWHSATSWDQIHTSSNHLDQVGSGLGNACAEFDLRFKRLSRDSSAGRHNRSARDAAQRHVLFGFPGDTLREVCARLVHARPSESPAPQVWQSGLHNALKRPRTGDGRQGIRSESPSSDDAGPTLANLGPTSANFPLHSSKPGPHQPASTRLDNIGALYTN